MRHTVLSLVAIVCTLAAPMRSIAQTGGVVIPETDPIPAGQAPSAEPYLPSVDALHYSVELILEGNETHIVGKANIRFEILDATLSALPLDFTGLAVRRVALDGVEVRAELERGRLLIPLPTNVVAGERMEAEILYEGTPDDGLVIQDNVHGDPSIFVDNWPNRTRFWFPSVDHPSDKATLDFTVHAPADWRVIANGRLVEGPIPVSEGALGGADSTKRTWRWESDVPHPTYTMVVGAANMEVREVGLAACGQAPASPRADGCIEVTYWVFPEDIANAEPSFRRAGEMVDYFTELVGPYPYEKLANVQSSTRFGGMENSSAIFYAEQAIARGANIEGTVSHEIAHQWFGDSVTEASWHHLWLSEGFATYFGALFFEHADGIEDFRGRMEQSRQTYLNSPDVNRPIIDPEERDLFALLNRNNYQKGGWVLHMLRGVLGDERFFDGIRTYYARHMNGTALTEDLRIAMEEAAGEDLGWFFDQWVNEPGYPILEARHAFASGEVVLTLTQNQSDDWPTFRLPTTVELRFSDGTNRREEIVLDRRNQEFRIPSARAPSEVVFDPDGWVLKRIVGEGGL